MEIEAAALSDYIGCMATNPASELGCTEKALRERIHRLFSDDPGPADEGAPDFWVGPTDDVVINIEDGLELDDKAVVEWEQAWLDDPRVEFGGRTPEQMLRAGEGSRRRLETMVAAMEDAVRGGAFR